MRTETEVRMGVRGRVILARIAAVAFLVLVGVLIGSMVVDREPDRGGPIISDVNGVYGADYVCIETTRGGFWCDRKASPNRGW